MLTTQIKAVIARVWERGTRLAQRLGHAWEDEAAWWTDSHHDIHAITTITENRYGDSKHRRDVGLIIQFEVVCFCSWTLRIRLDDEVVFEACEISEPDLKNRRRRAELGIGEPPNVVKLHSGELIELKNFQRGSWERLLHPKKLQQGIRRWKRQESELKRRPHKGKDEAVYIGPATGRNLDAADWARHCDDYDY